MKLSRRQWLQTAAAVGAATSLTGCNNLVRRYSRAPLSEELHLPDGPIEPTVRLVQRTSFGPAPGDIARVASLGHHRYIEEQLAADLPEPAHLSFAIARLDVFRVDAYEMRDIHEEVVVRQLQQAALLRATYSPNQLQERLVDFWTNHFNIYARKGLAAFRKGRDEVEVVRKHALGSFPQMLRASARSTAMLAYLDNQVNVRGVPNENYARELMELHSLGVHGGYSQRDVREVARCLTGWGFENRLLRRKGKLVFRAERHDDGEKEVLGHRIAPGGGEKDLDAVLDILCEHPSTAKHIAFKMCRCFLGDGAEKLSPAVAKEFTRTKGDIRSMVRMILDSKELMESPPILKRPTDYVVSCFRATHADTDCGGGTIDHLHRMGQPPYEWPMPDGYPDKNAAWTGTMLGRWNFAIALCSGAVPGSSVNLKELTASTGLAEAMLQIKPGEQQSKRLGQWASQVDTSSAKIPDTAYEAALLLCAPEFQWR